MINDANSPSQEAKSKEKIIISKWQEKIGHHAGRTAKEKEKEKERI
jgi:hypothetical protein